MPTSEGDQLLVELDGAVIRYLAAQHASLVESYVNPECDDPTADLVYRCITELRDAADAVLSELPRC